MGFLTVRFKHKSLFLLGIAIFWFGSFWLVLCSRFSLDSIFQSLSRNRRSDGRHCGFSVNWGFFAPGKKGNSNGVGDGRRDYCEFSCSPSDKRYYECFGVASCSSVVYLSIITGLFIRWFSVSSLKTRIKKRIRTNFNILRLLNKLLSNKSALACQFGAVLASLSFHGACFCGVLLQIAF